MRRATRRSLDSGARNSVGHSRPLVSSSDRRWSDADTPGRFYESEGRVFESPWAHSVFRVVSTRLRVGCVARLGWTSRAGVAACCCGATARTQADGPASHRGRRNPDLGASLSRLLARAHEALTRNAINLAAVACLPAFGFGVPGPSCHEVPN